MVLLSMAWDPIGRPALVFSMIWRWIASMRSCFSVGGFIGSVPMSYRLALGAMCGKRWLMCPAADFWFPLTSTFGMLFSAANFLVIVLELFALRRFSNNSLRLT